MKKLAILYVALIISASAFAKMSKHVDENGNSGKTSTGTESLAANCAPPTAGAELALNNVRTVVYTGGDMWWDLIGQAQYEVPKGSGKHSLFAGSLWMGGVDANNQLKIAALRFRQVGYDYWPGPLTTDGSASIDPATCAEWDTHFRITRQEVDEFVGWYSLIDQPELQAELYEGYQVPESILDWPAHGDVAQGQDFYLAPFYDADGSGDYNPLDGGDYPKYDLTGEIDCRVTRDPRLFGDETLWWVFNDKGNIHTETGAQAIGMEVRAQAFAFATNDEINNMTFYNYELINRGSFTLNETYFAQWVDPDLGFHQDDYVGCDVLRGLGYCYNGNAVDGSGGPQEYGANPPAVGVDFFEGPYQDNDGIDNAVGIGPNEALNGIGYGDGIVDNERFGMRSFLYHNNDNSVRGDPQTGPEYYNYLRGIWRDNTVMCYGGNGHPSGGCDPNIPADFMFPGTTDPLGWGTGGNPQPSWTEETANNLPEDRRFMHSAGPFTLEPGAVNDITVGVVWARAQSGGPFASVEKLKNVDDKAQALFENCFKVLDGPDAPDVEIIELDRELVITLTNRPTSNNFNENYEEVDPFIVSPPGETWDSIYRFEGYQIFQVKDASVSVADLHDPDLAREVVQVDIENGVGQLVNFTFSEDLEANIPVEEVDGADEGIKHSFSITQDMFASGNSRLVNHKEYHYIAIAYAYNNYKDYDQQDPLQLDGQKEPYKAGRKSATGAIRIHTGIPHIPSPENSGTIVNAPYGTTPMLRREEGRGNGGRFLALTNETVDEILNSSEHRVENPVYARNRGPVNIKVVDPKNVPLANFTFRMKDTTGGGLEDSFWTLRNDDTGEEVDAVENIEVANEQLILEWGLSVTVEQTEDPTEDNGFLGAELEFLDNNRIWLDFLEDGEGAVATNWIRSGITDDQNDPTYNDYGDDDQHWEKILGGRFSPYKLAAHDDGVGAPTWRKFKVLNKYEDLSSVDLVITPDKSKWSRCPVIETADDNLPSIGGARKMDLRKSPSVDKEGNPDGSGTMGMGWFPGYAINVETGERLNIMFGENSFLGEENGQDMIWNPTSATIDNFGNPLFGGGHYIYIMGHNGNDPSDDCPRYDEGQWIFGKLSSNNYQPIDIDKRRVYKDAMWVTMPLSIDNRPFLGTEVRVKIRVNRAYKQDLAPGWTASNAVNNNLPMYTFNTGDIATVKEDIPTAESALDLIKVVPNPYYAYSGYEENQLDNRVRITNLPEKCTVTIYTVSGTLIRQYDKDDPLTSLDWDLKNQAGIPIAGGLYIIHVKADGVGEKVVKWFGSLRPVDLDSF